MTANPHAHQFHRYLVAAGVRPASSTADDYTEERRADPNWRRPVADAVPVPAPVVVEVTKAEPLPSADTDWNQTRKDLA